MKASWGTFTVPNVCVQATVHSSDPSSHSKQPARLLPVWFTLTAAPALRHMRARQRCKEPLIARNFETP